jgi:hypothetical protein
MVMGGVPLLFLLSRTAARWALWGPPNEPEPKAWRAAGEYHPVPDDGGARVPAAAGGLVSRPQPAPEPTAPAGDGDLPADEVLARLERAADLHDRGALDDAEYERLKDSILDEEDGP